MYNLNSQKKRPWNLGNTLGQQRLARQGNHLQSFQNVLSVPIFFFRFYILFLLFIFFIFLFLFFIFAETIHRKKETENSKLWGLVMRQKRDVRFFLAINHLDSVKKYLISGMWPKSVPWRATNDNLVFTSLNYYLSPDWTSQICVNFFKVVPKMIIFVYIYI